MAKKTTKRTQKSKSSKVKHELIDTKTEDLLNAPISQDETIRERKPMKLAYIALLVLAAGLVGIFFTNKGLFVAAMVDGKPIFRWQLNKALVSRFGEQTVESMISEVLIADAAKKSDVVISQGDIDGKVAELLKTLGGDVKLEDLLKYQGMTKGDFEQQIRLQLTVEKVLTKDLTITDDDINSYIATNRAMLTATEEAGLKDEARQAIISQTVSEKLQPWFVALKEKAKILKFL